MRSALSVSAVYGPFSFPLDTAPHRPCAECFLVGEPSAAAVRVDSSSSSRANSATHVGVIDDAEPDFGLVRDLL